jgi:hypothetical protein
MPIKVPEIDQGLWGGEGPVKGYEESRPYTRKKILPRHWLPRIWLPAIKEAVGVMLYILTYFTDFLLGNFGQILQDYYDASYIKTC